MSFYVSRAVFALSLNLSLSLFINFCLTAHPAQASDASDKEDIQNTIFRYKAGLEVNPNDAKARLKLGDAYLTSGDADKAIAEFQKAVKLSPEEPSCYWFLGRAYGRKGQVQLACDNLKEAVRLAP